MIKEKLKPLLLDFVLPAAISILLAFIFKWDAGEIIWGIWGASFWLGLIFWFLAALIMDSPFEDAGSKAMAIPIIGFMPVLLIFQSYTAQLIMKGGIQGLIDGYDGVYVPYFIYLATKLFFPFIALYVYGEIKGIFFKGLDTGEQFIKFGIVFGRLQLIAFVCVYLGKYVPDILLYLIVFSICFFPINIFEREEIKHEDWPQ
ncbi:MAG: hypothetical protein LBI01_06210 [Elusimicrobium sp.]|jgi:hypothetical protein|nr:hypothetical protein [Elusimicrobium sp.]